MKLVIFIKYFQSKFILVVDTVNGSVRRLYLPGIDENDGASRAKKAISGEQSGSSVYRMCKVFSSDFNAVMFYQEHGLVRTYWSCFSCCFVYN